MTAKQHLKSKIMLKRSFSMDARHDGDSVLGGLRAPSLNVGVDTPGVGGQASTDFNNKINNRCNNYNSNTDGRKRKLIGNVAD